jgi:tripartite-type tricarboxylate transporter receptor subunit TctC
MKLKHFYLMAGMASALIGFLTIDASANDFYKGKTIRFIVGYAPGGGYDTYTRAIARHIGRFIPGHPTSIVENMEGAGSLLAAN